MSARSKMRQTLTSMLAVRELRLEGKGNRQVPKDQFLYVEAEVRALRLALADLEMFQQERLDLAKQKILLDWSEWGGAAP